MAHVVVVEASWVDTAASMLVTLLGLSVAVTVARIGLGMLRAYYILRIRGGTHLCARMHIEYKRESEREQERRIMCVLLHVGLSLCVL